MAGDARYGGFDNQQLSAYLGIPVHQVQMLQELMQGKGTQADYGLAQQFAGQGGGGPLGGSNRLDTLLKGFEHLQEHPMGSHHHGFNPTDLIADVATGGLYGLGKSAYGGLTGKENLFDAAKGGLNQLGPWGSSTYNIPGMGPQIAQTGNLIGAGAGIAGGGLAGTFSPSGFANPGALSAEGGFAGAGVADAGPGVFTGVSESGEPLYQGANALGKGSMTAEEMAANGQNSRFIGGAPLNMGGGSPLSGAGFGQSLAQYMGGGGGGATMMGPGGLPMPGASAAGALSPQQRASLGAQQSEAHRGLAPRFEERQAGRQEQPGLVNPQDLSLAALYGLGQPGLGGQ